MFFPVFFVYIAFASESYQLSAPLSAVCTTYVKLFQTTEFRGDEFDRFQQDWPIFQLLDIPYQEFDNVPQIEMLTVSVFMDLFLAQKDYCAQPEVASLAQQVADGTHPHALQIWETSILELVAVYSEMSSEEFIDGRRKLMAGVVVGAASTASEASAVTATASGASAGSAAIEVGTIAYMGGEGLIAFVPAVALVAAVGAAIYFGYQACHQSNHRRSLRALRRILNAHMKGMKDLPAETGLTIPAENLMLACTDGLQSFLCNAGIPFIAQAMTTAVCGGALTGFASCVFDFAAARDLLAIGDGN